MKELEIVQSLLIVGASVHFTQSTQTIAPYCDWRTGSAYTENGKYFWINTREEIEEIQVIFASWSKYEKQVTFTTLEELKKHIQKD